MTGEKKAAGDSVLILECLRTMRQNVMPGTLSSPVGFFLLHLLRALQHKGSFDLSFSSWHNPLHRERI